MVEVSDKVKLVRKKAITEKERTSNYFKNIYIYILKKKSRRLKRD